jgi:uncharacterized protein
MAPQAMMLPDGRRLHLNHGPIDLIIEVNAAARALAYARAQARFETVLSELVAELPALRRQTDAHRFQGAIARRMQAATRPHLPEFITPMAAVAGAVADEMLAAMCKTPGLTRAHVNNGGDVAFYLTDGPPMTAALAGGRITLRADQPWRGVATSGWRGRSHSLGIADAVTVVARSAALADAAATMIANAVDLPGHTAIRRRPAQDLAPDSDLGARLVTVAVGALSRAEIALALNRGATLARALTLRGVIGSACLALGGQTCVVDAAPAQIEPELSHA